MEGTGDEAERRDRVRALKANKPDNYVQLKNSLVLGANWTMTCLVFHGF